MRICIVEDCGLKHASLGYCLQHYRRFKKHGDPLIEKQSSPLDSIEKRMRRMGWIVMPSGCWEWQGGRGRFGHGNISIGGKDKKAHRVAYEMWVGPIPDGLVIRHKCDNPPCINPDHLEPGTLGDNARDMYERGRNRSALGIRQHLAKLDNQKVLDIRRLYAENKHTAKQLGEMFGVSKVSILNVVHRRTWAWLEE